MQKKNNSSMVIVIAAVFLVFLFVLFITFGKSGGGGQSGAGSAAILQQTAVQRLANESGQAVDYYAENGVMRHLSFEWSGQAGQSSQEVLNDFLDEFADLFNIADIDRQLQLSTIVKPNDGGTTYQFNQVYEGIPIYGAELVFHVSASGNLDWYEGGYIPNLNVDTSDTISEQQALDTIKDFLNGELIETVDVPQLMIFSPEVFGSETSRKPCVVWFIQVASETVYKGFFVDAKSNEVINTLPILESDISYQVYDAHQQWWDFWSDDDNPELVIDNGEVLVNSLLLDGEAKKLSEYINTIYDYYADNFNWLSFDGMDSNIKMYVNFKTDLVSCPNAWWNGSTKAMYYCNGMVGGIDIPAHEFTHGVTNSFGGFEVVPNAVSESKALAESFSDIFAAFIDNTHPWQICKSNCNFSNLYRDIEKPANTGYPANYSDLVEPGDNFCTGDEAEYGCGHVNSTIHSHAVYLFTNDIGEEKSSQIVFSALYSQQMPTNADFLTARRVIVSTCRNMKGQYNIQEQDCAAIEKAYDSVGILDNTITVEPEQEQPGSVITVIAPLPKTTTAPEVTSLDSEVVLVMDISGSMGDYDISGITKIAGAQHAASNLLDVIETEQEAFSGSVNHSVGLVTFSSTAQTPTQLTTSIGDVRNMIWDLYPDAQTAMADGLQAGIDQFDENNTSKQMIVLLSDGLPNASANGWFWNREDYQTEVVELAAQAGEQGICVYTIGFGDPTADEDSNSYIDEDFLREVASASQCGSYYSAQNAGQLADVFVELRHASMGSVLLQQSGMINQGENLDLGTFSVPGSQAQMLFTLNWPGSLLTADLIDPDGNTVDSSYQGATISSQDTITSIVITSPQAGNWQLQVFGQDVPNGVTNYNTVVSTRSAASGKSDSAWVWLVLGASVIIIAVVASTKPKQGVAAGNRQVQGPRLVFTNGSMAGKQVRLSADMFIGRDKDCQILVPDPSVSRKHARIRFAKNRWFIQDQNSRAGTIVNGKPVQSIRLRSGDEIRLGNTDFQFYEG